MINRFTLQSHSFRSKGTTVLLTCLSKRGHSQCPHALSATAMFIFVEEDTHNVHVFHLPLHHLTGPALIHSPLPTLCSHLLDLHAHYNPSGETHTGLAYSLISSPFLQHSLVHNTTHPTNLKIIQPTCSHPLLNPDHTPQLV